MFPIKIEYVLILIATFILSFILTPLVRFISFRVGAVDKPNARRINKTPMPSAGGLAIFISFLITTLFLMPKIVTVEHFGLHYFDYIFPVISACFVIVVVGYLDDIYELKPRSKMFGIFLAAVIIWYFTKFHFDSFKIPFGGPLIVFDPVLTFIVTILWIISITNAINLIDGLDGLVCGVSTISLLTMAVVSYFFLPIADFYLTLTILILVAAISGFFPYNSNPAIIYLGDTGALLIGFLIGVLSLQGLKNSTAVAVVTPVIILGVPIIDTLVAIVRRKLSGRPISEADKMHLHHRLLAMGFTHRGAVLAVYGIAIIFSLIAILLNLSSRLGGILLLIGCVFTIEILIESLEIWGENRTPLFKIFKFIGNSDYRQRVMSNYANKK